MKGVAAHARIGTTHEKRVSLCGAVGASGHRSERELLCVVHQWPGGFISGPMGSSVAQWVHQWPNGFISGQMGRWVESIAREIGLLSDRHYSTTTTPPPCQDHATIMPLPRNDHATITPPSRHPPAFAPAQAQSLREAWEEKQ